MRLGWFLSSALLKVKIKIGGVAFLEWDFQIVAVAVAVAAAVAAVAVAAVVDITAHLGGTAAATASGRELVLQYESEIDAQKVYAAINTAIIDN